MSDEQKKNDLDNELVEIAPGIAVESRLRVCSMMWLEKKLDMPFIKIFNRLAAMGDNEDIRLTEICLIPQALYMQTHECTEQEAEKAIGRIDITDLIESIGKITALDIAPKNDQAPGEPATTETTS